MHLKCTLADRPVSKLKHVFVEECTMDCINSAQKCTTVNISPKAQLNNSNQLAKSLHSTKNRAKDNVTKPNQHTKRFEGGKEITFLLCLGIYGMWEFPEWFC